MKYFIEARIGISLYEEGTHMSARKDEWGMTPESQLRAQKKYDKEHTVGCHIKLNTNTDQDIIRWLWGQRSKQGSIKRLIREEIAREKARTEIE